MGNPAYYLTTDSPPNPTEFPIAERHSTGTPIGRGAGAIAREHTDLVHETEEGVLWVYPQARRRTWNLTFRLSTAAHLAFFETLHNAVDGQANAFYFIPDIDESPMQEYLVRKDKDFMPTMIDAGVLSGSLVGVFDYVINLREESAAAQILA